MAAYRDTLPVEAKRLAFERRALHHHPLHLPPPKTRCQSYRKRVLISKLSGNEFTTQHDHN